MTLVRFFVHCFSLPFRRLLKAALPVLGWRVQPHQPPAQEIAFILQVSVNDKMID